MRIKEHISQKLFSQNSVFQCSGTKECILIFAYYTQVFTAKELYYDLQLSDELTDAGFRTVLTRLLKERLLGSETIPHEDCGSRVYYYLTRRGYKEVSALIPNIEPFNNMKNKKAAYIMHDYSVGMNCMQFFLTKLPFLFFHETGFSSNIRNVDVSKNIISSVSTDAFVAIPQIDRNHLYFIEQDMGTEKIKTLKNKVTRYLDNNLLSDERMEIIFSFRTPYLDVSNSSSVSPQIIENLRNVFTSGILSDLSVDGKLKEAVNEIIQCVPGGGTFSPADLATYHNMLLLPSSKRGNVYQITLNNIAMYRQIAFAKARYYTLTTSLSHDLKKLNNLTRVLSYYLDGGSTYITPTCKLSEMLPRIYRGSSITAEGVIVESDFFSKLAKDLLPRYFSGLDFDSYVEKRTFMKCKPCTLSNLEDHPVTFRNCYTYFFHEQKCYISLELLSDDIGSFVRCHYAFWHLETSAAPITVILIANEIEDVKKFCEHACYYLPYAKIFFGKFSICFHVIGEEHLFIINMNGDIKPVY